MNSDNLILLIEDSKLDIHLVQRILELNEYDGDLHCVETVADAMEYTQSLVDNNKPLPNLILLDMFFAKDTGDDYLNYFENLSKDKKKGVHIVIMSATKLLFDAEKLLENENVAKVLDKPFKYEKVKVFLNE